METNPPSGNTPEDSMRGARIVRIVVASPDDVQAERDLLHGIIEELNRGIAADRGLRLELFRWEMSLPRLSSRGAAGTD